MKRCRTKGLCCGAGGAQMFKEEEKGNLRINQERIEEALETGSDIVAAALSVLQYHANRWRKTKGERRGGEGVGCGGAGGCEYGIKCKRENLL